MKTVTDMAMEDSKNKSGLASIRAINKVFRQHDESHIFPISGKFDVTERAIRQIRKEGYAIDGLEYCEVLEARISQIVKDGDNW